MNKRAIPASRKPSTPATGDCPAVCFLHGLCRGAYSVFDPSVTIQDEYWVLDYFYDEGLTLRIGHADAPEQLRHARSACLYKPMTRRWQANSRTGKTLRGAWAVFLPTADADMDQLVAPNEDYTLFDDPSGILGDVIADLNATQDKLPGGKRVDRDLPIVDILLRILRAATPTGSHRVIHQLPPGIETDLLVTKVDYYLRHHFAEPIGRDDIARHMNLSSTYLSRKYAERTGATPMQVLMNIRTHAAARMLEHGLQLKDTARKTGFCDTSHLSRAFSSALGRNPRRFLKELGQRDAESLTDLPGAWDYHRSSTCLQGLNRLSRDRLDPHQKIMWPDQWVLDAFLTPGVRFRAESERQAWVEESPGWLRLYSPGCPYWEDSRTAERPIISLSLCFVALPSSCIAIKYGDGPVCIRFHDPNHRIITRLQQLHVLGKNRPANALHECMHIFLKLLVRLTRAQQIGPNMFEVVDKPSANPLVARVTSHLEKHHRESLSLAHIARQAGVSVSTLTHVYSDATGEGCMQTLKKIRIRHARVLLAQGVPVAKVAEQVGFDDPTTFSKVFSQSDRMPPTQYQQLSRVSSQ